MGWGDAWAGLSQQAFAATINSLEEREQRKYQDKRDQIARKAADSQERSRREYEERMLNKRAALDAQARQEDFKMRKGLAMQEQSFRAQESAADRAIRERQLAQNEAYNQGQLGLQARGLGLREQEMEMMASRPQQTAQGISTARISQVINSKAVKDKTTPEEQYEAARQIDPAVADAAFPALAARRQQAAQNVGRVVTGVEDLLNKYLNQ
jgi:hypothetical protein